MTWTKAVIHSEEKNTHQIMNFLGIENGIPLFQAYSKVPAGGTASSSNFAKSYLLKNEGQVQFFQTRFANEISLRSLKGFSLCRVFSVSSRPKRSSK